MRGKKPDIRIWAVCFWLLLWELTARAAGSGLFFVPPSAVIIKLAELLPEKSFWLAVLYSSGRVSLGYIAAFFAAILLAAAAFEKRRAEELLSPLMLAIRSVPVASFVILALIFFGSGRLSSLIAFLIVLPQIYGNTLAGLRETDTGLLEAASSLGMGEGTKLRYLRFPSAFPYIKSACRTAVGMAWKAGAAAEVIGNPRGSIGGELYKAKIYLETPELLAWTLAIIVLSLISEKIFMFLLNRLGAALLKLR